jgi:NUMOD3 motif
MAHTEETKQKIREAQLKRVRSPEEIAKSKQPKSQQFKQYMSQTMTGRPKSEETKAKMRESALRRWANREQ